MEVHLTDDLRTGLQDLSTRTGRSADELIQDAVSMLLADDDSFREGVLHALDQLDRGEFIDQDEMAARIGQMFKS